MTCDAEDEISNITIKYPLINITMINGISFENVYCTMKWYDMHCILNVYSKNQKIDTSWLRYCKKKTFDFHNFTK